MSKVIGLISDTHGLVRDEIKREFRNVDRIIHAGDIGNMEVVLDKTLIESELITIA